MQLPIFSCFLWQRDLLWTLPFRKRVDVNAREVFFFTHLFSSIFSPPPDEWLSVAQINLPLSNMGSLNNLWMCVHVHVQFSVYALMCRPFHEPTCTLGLAMSKYKWQIWLVTVHLLCLNTTLINRDPSPPWQNYFLSPSQCWLDRLEAL